MGTEPMSGALGVLNTIQIEPLLKICQTAGKLIMDVYRSDFSVDYKDDKSPLTMADTRSNACIREALETLHPDIPILSEETQTAPYEERKHWEWFWLVDPLDGTREFVKKNDEFTINIALVHKDTPVLGIINAPALNKTVYAIQGKGCYGVVADKHVPLTGKQANNEKSIVIIGSRSHGSERFKQYVNELQARYEEVEIISAGSALKFCLLAEGKADIYPRLGPTMEWDTAAGHVIVNECGKQLSVLETGKPLYYNKPELLNPFFVCQ